VTGQRRVGRRGCIWDSSQAKAKSHNDQNSQRFAAFLPRAELWRTTWPAIGRRAEIYEALPTAGKCDSPVAFPPPAPSWSSCGSLLFQMALFFEPSFHMV